MNISNCQKQFCQTTTRRVMFWVSGKNFASSSWRKLCKETMLALMCLKRNNSWMVRWLSTCKSVHASVCCFKYFYLTWRWWIAVCIPGSNSRWRITCMWTIAQITSRVLASTQFCPARQLVLPPTTQQWIRSQLKMSIGLDFLFNFLCASITKLECLTLYFSIRTPT